jgi:hypothetical protein
MKRSLAAAICITLLTLSCSKHQEEVTGTVKNFSGLDGCGVVIVLDNGTNLEPDLLPAGVTLMPDKRVSIKFSQLSGRVSNCMVGYIVRIISLRYL